MSIINNEFVKTHVTSNKVIKKKPDGILVFGDTNSTLAASLYGALNYIPVFHSEGGERIYRRNQLPEEINRCTADSLSSLIFTSSLKAKNNLILEGIHQKNQQVANLLVV